MACVVLPQAKPFEQFRRGVFIGDDSFSVDRLVASCQPRAMPALPSGGRALVPYFDSPDDCINQTLSKPKVDSARKKKRSSKKTTNTDLTTLRNISPVKLSSKQAAQKLQHFSKAGAGNKRACAEGSAAEPAQLSGGKLPISVTPKDLKAWAGPSYYTSPPPEHLPMPTAFLLAV